MTHRFELWLENNRVAINFDGATPSRAFWLFYPAPEELPHFRQWLVEVYRSVSDMTGEVIAFATMKGGVPVLWTFRPGKEPVVSYHAVKGHNGKLKFTEGESEP